jgi:hypothetical protein
MSSTSWSRAVAMPPRPSAFGEQHDGHPMSGHKAIQFRHKAAAHRAHQGRGGQRLPAMVAKKAHRPAGALQPWHVDVEVHVLANI